MLRKWLKCFSITLVIAIIFIIFRGTFYSTKEIDAARVIHVNGNKFVYNYDKFFNTINVIEAVNREIIEETGMKLNIKILALLLAL
jgi:hypothetical protein